MKKLWPTCLNRQSSPTHPHTHNIPFDHIVWGLFLAKNRMDLGFSWPQLKCASTLRWWTWCWHWIQATPIWCRPRPTRLPLARAELANVSPPVSPSCWSLPSMKKRNSDPHVQIDAPPFHTHHHTHWTQSTTCSFCCCYCFPVYYISSYIFLCIVHKTGDKPHAFKVHRPLIFWRRNFFLLLTNKHECHYYVRRVLTVTNNVITIYKKPPTHPIQNGHMNYPTFFSWPQLIYVSFACV